MAWKEWERRVVTPLSYASPFMESSSWVYVSKSILRGFQNHFFNVTQLFDDQVLGAVKDEDCCTSLICLSGMKRTYGKNC